MNTSTRCGDSAGSPQRQTGRYHRQESPQHELAQKPPRRGSLRRRRQNPCSEPAESAHYAPPACQNTRASPRDSGSRYREPAAPPHHDAGPCGAGHSSGAQKHTSSAAAAHHQAAHYPSADEAPSTRLSPPRLCAQRARKPACQRPTRGKNAPH